MSTFIVFIIILGLMGFCAVCAHFIEEMNDPIVGYVIFSCISFALVLAMLITHNTGN